ncbi:unnamed protein product [Danaus chrysippus]|uniref:(African queen) hypothetical protein n=1 Tax=Danaus chrysippus TaxID=151541 RepID=A0A8J2VWC0_9NEOP|nr:unnamed protein product [Danaus chrysippus]
MKVTTVIVLLLLNYNRCLTIRVPVEWTQDSEVNKSEQIVNTEQNGEATQKPIYKDYFQYTAQKPQFAVDVAIAHDVQSPENLYKAHPVRPYTNLAKPVLGQHHILDPNRNEFQPYQKFIQKSESAGFITPASTSFEVFHPYKAEEPYLQQIYRDPVLSKIRNDLRDSKNRLQNYENEAGQTDVKGTEYLESLHETDRKKIPHKNIPTQFEMHRPHRRPIYYRPPFNHNHREHFLNNKLKSPWRTNVAKITPAHYRPIKHHLHGLRQQHAMKFDDERNEYPQALPPEETADVPEGYDIYEKGKQKYKQIKNNAEELINKPENNRVVHPHLEPVIRDDTSGEDNDNNGDNDDSDEYDEDDFVPIKNYAQVRKTESTRHLPKQAAFYDAESLEEIKNAPRLREAIKSTKAQTVYSEEGYEDGAYDHGGEEKHASDHEGHGGYLKEHEISGGKYKIPTVIGSHEDEKAAAYRDQILDNNKWEDSKKQTDDEEESDDYSEHGEEHSDDDYTHNNNENVENDRHKRDGETKFSNKNITKNDNDLKNLTQQIVQDNRNKSHSNHDVIKRDTGPNVSQTSLPHEDMALQKNKSPQVDNILFKYPYYNKEIKKLNKNSPFRYAENIKLIPKKTEGGTEFYDSRSNVHCPEVESDVDPIPDKIKKGGHPDENEEDYSEETGSKNINKSKKQRLSGLGDKIDCFKLKYFGENPLDSPFFKETKIENPEPIILQNVTDIFSVLDKFHKKNIKTSRFTNGEGNNNDTVITQSFGLTKTLPQTAPFYQKDIDRDFVSKNRKKRAAPFVYEPYKIIKDSQTQDSKKTTTTGNVSPLIKQLQSSRIIDKVSSVQDKNQGDKINSHSKLYKDISKEDRQNHTSDQSDSLPKFVDVSSDERRGEPRFEIKPSNHKTSYSPVESRRVMSTKDYESRKKGDRKDNVELNIHPRPVERNYFDVSQYLPQNMELQNLAASTAVKKVIRTTTSAPLLKHREEIPHSHENKEDYNEYEDEDEDEDEDDDEDDDDEENIEVKTTSTTTTSTTSTTQKPLLRKRSRGTTSPRTEIENITESPKLKIVTRFHSPKPMKFTETKENNDEQDDTHREYTPKYTELKKKSRARTLVTDTQVYGDNDDDTRKLEVDKLIGVKQDMDDYLPLYEKTKTERDYNKNKVKMHHDTDIQTDDRDDDNVGNEKDDDNEEIEEEDDDEDEDDDDEDEEDDDEGELENDEDDEDERLRHQNLQKELFLEQPYLLSQQQ